MEERTYTVYCHTNKINDKKYIGITKRKPHIRWGKKGSQYAPNNSQKQSNTKFYNAILKYGWDNFEHEILVDKLTKEEAYQKEIDLILYYNSTDDKFGYNIDKGGFSGHVLTEEQMLALKERTSKGNNPMAKKVYCDGMIFECMEECADYYNLTATTLSNWIKGNIGIPKEFIEKELHYIGEDINYKLRDTRRVGLAKEVICENNLFNSAKECSLYYNIKQATITKWLNGINPMPKEWIEKGLKYKEEKQRTRIQFTENKRWNKVYCVELDIVFNSISNCIKYFKDELDINIRSECISKIISNKENNRRHSTKGYHFLNYENYKNLKMF